jgi:hypothetical protein
VWLLANLRGSLLLSTSNRSEAAVGYATMDGDTAGSLGPIGGVGKTFLRHWLNRLENDTLAGFGPVPLASLPMQVDVTSAEQIKDLGIRRLSDIARIDAAVGDGYNAEGYYDFLSVRGFVIDNRFNYRRDGLPISAETSLMLPGTIMVLFFCASWA